MPIEPAIQSTRRSGNTYSTLKANYAGRWRWWYASISDWMIEHPGGKLTDCALALNRSYNTIILIAGTDLFRDFHAQRMAEYRRTHDFALAHKLTAVAEEALDLTLATLKKKGDQVPLANLVEITSSSLEKLGYGAKPTQPSVVVNNNQQVIVPVSASELVEAREALRRSEQRRIEQEPSSTREIESEAVEIIPDAP